MTTIDFTPDQCRYIRRLVLLDLLANQQLVRDAEIETYSSAAIVQIHEDIATASVLVVTIPEPKKEGI